MSTKSKLYTRLYKVIKECYQVKNPDVQGVSEIRTNSVNFADVFYGWLLTNDNILLNPGKVWNTAK